MGVSEHFGALWRKTGIGEVRRELIADRSRLIIRSCNREFWNSDRKAGHGFFIGSYGRDTAFRGTTNIDMIQQLPAVMLANYITLGPNGPAALLADVNHAILRACPHCDVRVEDRAVVVNFGDALQFNVVPAFASGDDGYSVPIPEDGTWGTIDPKKELREFDRANLACNCNIKVLARIARSWKATWNVPLSGLLLDTLVYNFLRDYEHRTESFHFYDRLSRDFFKFVANQNDSQQHWVSPAGQQRVPRTGSFEPAAEACYQLAVSACEYEGKSYGPDAQHIWGIIYGNDYPASQPVSSQIARVGS